MIDQITVAKILDAAEIVDVVSDFVSLKRAGANLKGLCPFHDDTTPSFMVSPSKNYCKCFACGEGGSPVGFIMKHENLTYPDALRYLARKYGIPIQEKAMTEDDRQARDDRESMYIVNEWARDWFRRQMMETQDGRAIGLAYFHGRGFRDDILQKFQVGFSPDSRTASLSQDALKAGYQEKYLTNVIDEANPQLSVGTGLSLKRDDGTLRDRFRGRVMWPIFTLSGRVAGFGGRVLDAATKGVNVKYMNSPESIIYSKRKELFGLYQAKEAIRKKDLCYLVEGYTDVMGMHQSGVENVVASSGTALTKEQVRLIHRLTNNIVAIFDGDEAGIHASERSINMFLADGMNVKLLLLPDNDDPDSFARKHTAEEFQNYLKDNQVDFIQYKILHLMQAARNDVTKMSELVHNVADTIAVIPDEITRTLYIKQAATLLSMQEPLIVNAVVEARRRQAEERQKEQTRAFVRQQNAAAAQQTSAAADVAPSQPSQPVAETADDGPTPEPPLAQPAVQAPLRPQQPAKSPSVMQPEYHLAQIMVRYGERSVVNVFRDEYLQAFGEERLERERALERAQWQPGMPQVDEETVPLRVMEYIHLCMLDHELEWHDARFAYIMREGLEHVLDEGFTATHYFSCHPDYSISSLAVELGVDPEILSRYHEEEDVASNLVEIIPKLLACILTEETKEELAKIQHQLKHLSPESSAEERRRLLQKYQEVRTKLQAYAQQGGGNVMV